MKHLIFIISLFTLVFWNLSCTKESLEKEETKTEKTVFHIEDFDVPNWGRDGVKAPFGFDVSWTIVDLFTPGLPQMAINQNPNISDRIELTKVPLSPNVNYQGIKSYYITDFYFSDSTKNFSAKIYWDYLNGNQNTLYPNQADSQVSPTNLHEWTKITRRQKTVDYLDINCGTDKKLIEHKIETPTVNKNDLVQSNRCNSNYFSYKYY